MKPSLPLISPVILAGAFFCCVNAVQAQGFQDPSTGFGVKPPAPFKAEQTTNRRQFDVGVGISSSTGKPAPKGTGTHVCEAGFKAAPQNADLSIADINKLTDTPQRQKQVRDTIEMIFLVTRTRTFTLQGVRGLEFEGRPRFGPDAENARMMMSMIETPKGRVTKVCVTSRAEIDKALPQFRAIRAGLTLPK
ncbi:MAG: hypothetical protein ACRCWF_01335 [Beijerinckiaceae bacterium]